jgi:alkyldihydroxyacetonephosphate synthase
VLGVITEVTLRVRPRPAEQRVDAYSLSNFAAGTEALREFRQARGAADFARLSHEAETRISLALASRPAAGRARPAYLKPAAGAPAA